MTILAIDPGPSESGFVLAEASQVLTLNGWPKIRIEESGTLHNDRLRLRIEMRPDLDAVVVEWVEHFGMPAGASLFETCREIGRYEELCDNIGTDFFLVPRREVKLFLCQSSRAKDANVRQALIDQLGPPGKKSSPGPTYGVSGHAWAALGVLVTHAAKS